MRRKDGKSDANYPVYHSIYHTDQVQSDIDFNLSLCFIRFILLPTAMGHSHVNSHSHIYQLTNLSPMRKSTSLSYTAAALKI